jgi:hypothetical protein
MRYALFFALCLTAFPGTARAQTTADVNRLHNAIVRDRIEQHQLQRYISDRRAALMHMGVIPRPGAKPTPEDIEESRRYDEEVARDAAAAAAPPQRRLGRAARAARNHPPLPRITKTPTRSPQK